MGAQTSLKYPDILVRIESCDVTIQMKPLSETFCIILFTTRDLQKNGIFCEFFTLSITRSERVNIKLKLTLQAADEYTNNTTNPVIRKPRGLYITIFHYTDQFPIKYHNSDCQSNEPITSQVLVTGVQRGKMGVSLDRSSDWWRKWRDIFGGQSHSVAMQLKQSRLLSRLV